MRCACGYIYIRRYATRWTAGTDRSPDTTEIYDLSRILPDCICMYAVHNEPTPRPVVIRGG